MKNLFVSALIGAIFSLNFLALSGYVMAEGEGGTDVPTDTDIDVVLSVGEQDPGSKEFDLIATINPQIDSSRVLVDWRLPQQVVLAEEEDSATSRLSIEAGKSVVVRKRVRARFAGKYTVEVKVTAIKADFNYITADKKTFEFNESLEILPMTEEYKQAKLFRNIRIVLTGTFVVIAIGSVGYFGYKKIRVWINTPG